MSYTFRSVYVDGKFHNNYNITITNVIGCVYNNFIYNVNYSWGCVEINTSPIKSFEDMFPVFPYVKNELNTNKIDKIEARIDKLECEIVKLLSHVEAIMTVLQQRLPTDEPLTL